MSPEHLDAIALKLVVAESTARSAAATEAALVRPWVQARLEGGTAAISEFVQYGDAYEFRADESVDRGGQASAPSPLRYLLSSVAFCALGWCSKTWALRDVAVHDMSIHVRTMMDTRGEHLIEGVPAHPQWFVLELSIEDDSSDDASIDLWREAARRCPISSLVALAVPLYLMLTHNGRPILDERPEELRSEHRQEQTR